MAEINTIEPFLDIVRESLSSSLLSKITLGKARKKNADLKNIFIRPILIRQTMHLSFVYRYPTKDITKNMLPEDGLIELSNNMKNDFFQANLSGQDQDVQLLISKKGKYSLTGSKASVPLLQTFSHDKIKRRIIDASHIYLQKLGITSAEGKVYPKMNDKFKQINKFIEIIEGFLPAKKAEGKFSVVDMGSGKGYLTFALYDYLNNMQKMDTEICGVELRKDLVDKCNHIARESDFNGLSFTQNNIRDYSLSGVDMLIALHACDTATDDAIFKGIVSGAQYIIVAPCCHKQVRKAMTTENELAPVLRHGVYLERQAELITDGIRGLILEKYGYKTKALEFISSEHTPKNVMIMAAKTQDNVDQAALTEKIEKIKKSFGIEYHHLEVLLADTL